MHNSLPNLQGLYEIAISMGNSLDMQEMLQESIGAYVHKLNLTAGAVHQKLVTDGEIQWDPVYTEPHGVHEKEIFQAAMAQIMTLSAQDRDLRHLPLSGRYGNAHYHIMALPDFGLLILTRDQTPLDEDLLKAVLQLNTKLATACRFCLGKSDNQKIAADLKRENMTRNRAEEALKESHERLLTVLNSIDVLIYAADLDTHEIVFMNHRMETLFGKEVMGKPCFEILRGEAHPCPHCTNDALLDPDGRPAEDIVWEDRSSITKKWYIHQARAIKWLDGRWVRLEISTDITRLKQLEQERIKEAHLQQTQRLEALGILAGGVAHEYNNLLMSMLGNLSLINFKIDITHPFHRYLKKIEESIRVAATLTDQLLGYAQKGRYENQNLQINTLIRATVAEFSSSHESIRLHMDLDIELHLVEADQRQIEHVLWNLIGNAVDAMPDGGDLFIVTRNVKRRDLRNKPYVLNREEYIELLIEDTGKGMSTEVQNHIFDPFYTTKPMLAGKGAGLGMAATYGIIKAHEGFIEVTSKEGVGSKFMVYLPATAYVGSGIEPPGAKPSLPTQTFQTILLVDDDTNSLEIGTQILEQLGYAVIIAKNGMEAVAQYQRRHDNIDVVIMDMVMPEMSGVETFEQIKSKYPDAKILMASGYLLDAEARRLLEHGAEGFVKKPFAIEELHATIQRAVPSPRVA